MDLELQGALSEKTEKFGYADVSVLKDLIQDHVANSEKKMAALGKTGPTIQAAQLERQAFDIAVANIKHDLSVYKVYYTRNQDREAAIFFQQLQHKQARKQAAKDIGKSLCDRTSSLWKVKLCNLGTASECLQEFHSMRSQVMKLEGLNSKDQVLGLVLLNWAAPSSYTSVQQSTQAALCGALVNSEAALGAVLSPVWFHKKGQLWKLEEACNKHLSGANLNCDSRFALPFGGKNDDREKRTEND